jgi:hypothetical protein
MSTQTVPPINQVITLDQAKIAEFTLDSQTRAIQARDFIIESQGDYEFSLTIAEDAIKRQKAIAEFFAPAKKTAFDLHRMITRMENDLLAPYLKIEQTMKQRRQIWRQEQENERLRIEAEARRIAKEEADRNALEDAALLEKQGNAEAAQEVLTQAMNAPAPTVVVQSSVPKQAGSAVRKKFSYRIDNEAAVEREFCSPDPKKIKTHLDAHGMASKISGVTVFPDETEAIRTKR